MKNIEGILPLWKPAGLTSHDCVAKVRRLFQTKKVGHAGTLDPDVEGVLPIAIGTATKVLEFMLESGKTYHGTIIFGASTTTEDASGEIIEEKAVSPDLTMDIISEKMKDFIGEITQVPPMYSAVKVKGQPLYKYARAGVWVERPKRQVMIYSFHPDSDLRFINRQASFDFQVQCSKGTYIRTLSVDLGKALNYPAHMSKLVRTESSGILANETVKFEEIEKLLESYSLETMAEQVLLSLERGLTSLPHFDISKEQYEKVKHGSVFPSSLYESDDFPAVLTYQGHAVAIYEKHPKKSHLIKPKKVLRT